MTKFVLLICIFIQVYCGEAKLFPSGLTTHSVARSPFFTRGLPIPSLASATGGLPAVPGVPTLSTPLTTNPTQIVPVILSGNQTGSIVPGFVPFSFPGGLIHFDPSTIFDLVTISSSKDNFWCVVVQFCYFYVVILNYPNLPFIGLFLTFADIFLAIIYCFLQLLSLGEFNVGVLQTVSSKDDRIKLFYAVINFFGAYCFTVPGPFNNLPINQIAYAAFLQGIFNS